MNKMLCLFCAALAATALSGCLPQPANLVSTDGSTSVERTVGTLGEAYALTHPDFKFTFNPTGSAAGIAAVLEGRCDIGLSSRALRESEQSAGLTGTTLAYDGIAVIVHPDNPITDLPAHQLAALYTGSVTDWGELGGTPGPVVLIGREAGSGTRDGFETALAVNNRCQYRQELTATGDVIATVAQNPSAIGYTSLASVKEGVLPLSVNGVSPTAETVADGSYPIARPFVLVTRSEEPLRPGVQAFFDYITSPEATEYILLAGVIPAA